MERKTERDKADEAGKYDSTELTQILGALCEAMWTVFIC